MTYLSGGGYVRIGVADTNTVDFRLLMQVHVAINAGVSSNPLTLDTERCDIKIHQMYSTTLRAVMSD
jgi:hypothetical protein